MSSYKPFSAVYVAKPEFISELCDELENVSDVIGNLVFSPVIKQDVCFALDVWWDPKVIQFNSISEAVRELRQAGKFWYLNPLENVRRSHLITEQLRKLPQIQLVFPLHETIPDIGCFSLLDKNTLVYSARRWKKWPMGHYQFIEDKHNPPNRAYLKLWEALSLLDHLPKPGETALDLGASPGGWTYVMQSLGTQVTAVDKAALDPHIANLPGVSFLRQSAFALNPETWTGKIDWLLSDIACYPDRLYELLTRWIASNKAKQLIFTVKLQGKTDLSIIRQFQAIPDSSTLHLFNNKHEVTFFHPAISSLDKPGTDS